MFRPLLSLLALAVAFARPVLGDPQYETRSVHAVQPNAQTWTGIAFATPFAAPPVVIAGPVTNAGGDPLNIRVRNVTAQGFEYQMDEWDYENGAHGLETFSYLAIEPGTFQMSGVTWEAGRAAGITRASQTVTFAAPLSTAPVVFTQVESTANASSLVARASAVSSSGFAVQLQTQASETAPLAPESVCYLAVSVGTGTLGGAPFRAERLESGLPGTWRPVGFGGSFPSPLLLAQPQSVNSLRPCTVRRGGLSSTGVQFLLQGESSQVPNDLHASEQLGMLVMAESEGELRANLEVGSFQRAQADRATWNSVTFAQPYTNPVVVFGPVAEGDDDPAMVRVRNVTSAGFEYQVEEWAYEDGVHGPDAVSYLVAEAGVYTIGGARWVFGSMPGVTTTPEPHAYPATMPGAPVVFSQVVTTKSAEPARSRVNGVTTTGFYARLEVEADSKPNRPAETVDYVAIVPSSGRLVSNHLLFEAGFKPQAVTDVFAPLAFARTFVFPFFFAETQSNVSARTIVPRYRNLTGTGAEVRVQQETSRNSSLTHPPESLGYLAFSSAVDMDEDGMADSWEVAHGLNPNDPSDAALDPDGDGRTNLQEFLDGTDPNVPDGEPVLTVEVLAANAYKKEGTPAQFLLHRTSSGGPLTVSYSISGTATAPEYKIADPTGAPLAGTVTFAPAATTAEIDLVPVADGSNRYPETVTLSVNAQPLYQLGQPAAGSISLADAAPTPENDQLFIAYLAPQGSAQTYASGVGTLYLNGPKNAARVSLSFSGLTSAQTNAYLRYGVPNGIGTELRATLGTGQIANATWTIVPAGPYSGQSIIDALYQKNGLYTYVNLGTGNYPAGEIAGTWTRQTGSTFFTPPANPPAIEPVSGADLSREVARFLTQATFGPSQADLDALTASVTNVYHGDRIAAFSAWIDQQFALSQTNLLDLTQAADAEEWNERGTDPINYASGNEPRDNNRRRSWWLLAARANDGLRQRVAFALSELFVISDQLSEVRSRHYGTAHYYDQLAGGVTGNYRDLLETVTKSPMMGKYLSSLQNQKAVVDGQTGQVLISPDENYAREVMQLFSIGLVKRYLDGSLQLASDGTPIATYSNADITDLARVFTGWSFSMRNGPKSAGYPVQANTTFLQGDGPAYFQAEWTSPMTNFAAYHDTGSKQILGQSIAAGLSGQDDLTAALNILFAHQNVAPFLARQLIERLVTSNPSAGYIYRVAQQFEAAPRGDMKAVIKAILLDYEARSLDVVENVGYGKQKEPIVRYLQLLRAGGAQSGIPLATLSNFGYSSAQLANFPAGTSLYRYPITDSPLGQSPLSAPTVFNWFLPDFNPGGAIGAAGLVAPEMQITSETTVAASLNYHFALAETNTGQYTSPLVKPNNQTENYVKLDRTPFEAVYNSAVASGQTVPQATATLLDHLDALLTSGNLKAAYASAPAPNPRSIILDSVSSLAGGTTTTVRVMETLYLLLTTPEFIHQK